jgi:PEP-CTERM motif
MNKITLAASAACLFLATQAAQGVNFSISISGIGQTVKASGTTNNIAAGTYIALIGYLSNVPAGTTEAARTAAEASLTGGVYANTLSLFVPLGMTRGTTKVSTVNTTINGETQIRSNATGTFNGVVENINNTIVPQNTQLYVLFMNTTSASATPTEWALVRGSTWLTASDVAPASFTQALAISTIDNLDGAGAATNEFVYGTKGSIILGPNVPEPTTFGLAALGMLGFVRRRRA